jgi:hypothetical protein
VGLCVVTSRADCPTNTAGLASSAIDNGILNSYSDYSTLFITLCVHSEPALLVSGCCL